MATQLTLSQVRSEIWHDLGPLQCNFTAATDLDQYINKVARERGITLPATDISDIRVIPKLAEIYALNFLYNRAINNFDVTMGGKKMELSAILKHIMDKMNFLMQMLPEDAVGSKSQIALASKVTMTFTPTASAQKVDTRATERYEG